MPSPNWMQLFLSEIRATPVLEWIGVSFGMAEVLFAKVNNIVLYPCGIISVVVSSYIFFNAGLYAESLLNAYYLIMSIYGWLAWIRRKNQASVVISASGRQDWIIASLIAIVGFAGLAFALQRWTASTVPYWDAWVSATAWAGMWLLARRKIENWILLNISNAFAIPLLIYKSLPLYAVLTFVLFVIAVQGFFIWEKQLAGQDAADSPPKSLAA